MKNAIKILGISLLLMCATGQAYSQKCKYDYQKEDKITGETTKGSTFSIKMWWKLGLNKNGNQYFIGMWIRINGNIRDVITPENTIIFKLENGEIITINANEDYFPSAQTDQYGVYSDFNARFSISEEDMKKLAASPLVYVKVGVGARVYDESFATKKGRTFQNLAKCMLQ